MLADPVGTIVSTILTYLDDVYLQMQAQIACIARYSHGQELFYKFVSKITNKLVKQLLSMTVCQKIPKYLKFRIFLLLRLYSHGQELFYKFVSNFTQCWWFEKVDSSQCENFRNLLPLRIYVKSQMLI